MERTIYAMGLSREENILKKLWYGRNLRELKTREDGTPKPLSTRILYNTVYYAFCTVATVLYPLLLAVLVLVIVPIGLLTQQLHRFRKTPH